MKNVTLQYRKGSEQLLMIFLGPLIGSLFVAVFVGAVFGSSVFGSSVFGEILFFGYFLGLPPAICTATVYGIIVKRAEREIRRSGTAAILGGVFSFLEGLLLFARGGPLGEFMAFAAMIGGAGAAFVCTYLGRRGLFGEPPGP
jgi:hypothetical protein